ncbi:MAG: hypothetical protein IJM32_09045 [Ruminococcus sp.]|nr:hypothetical protein [Ruminococcus sp.]
MAAVARIVWAVLLGLVSLTSYPAVIHGFIIRRKTAAKRVKLEPFGSNAVIIYPHISWVLSAAAVYSILAFKKDNDYLHIVVMAAELLAALVFLIVWLCRSSIYLTDTHIILPDSARNAKQCSYCSGGGKVEFTFVTKFSKRQQMFRIVGDAELAEKMLKEHYNCSGRLVELKNDNDDADENEEEN